MTEFEVVDALSSLRSEGADHVMNFVAVMFSYVLAAYVVGPRLTSAQALLVTVLYSIFVPGPILAVYESMTVARDIHELYGKPSPSPPPPADGCWPCLSPCRSRWWWAGWAVSSSCSRCGSRTGDVRPDVARGTHR